MTRIARLYSAVLDNPRASLSFRDFERLLSAFGFRLDRVTGIDGWLGVARDRGFPIPEPRYRPAIYAA